MEAIARAMDRVGNSVNSIMTLPINLRLWRGYINQIKLGKTWSNLSKSVC